MLLRTHNLSKKIILTICAALLLSGYQELYAEELSTKCQADIVYHADIMTMTNPNGAMINLGGFRRWAGPIDERYGIPVSNKKLGLIIGVNPAYSQASAYGEWQPGLFARLRLQYDLYRYFGENGTLLSFPSSSSRFGKSEVDALSGKEEVSWGNRMMLQSEISARVGSIILRNTNNLAYYRFNGKGPYFLEYEYDTLLKNGDLLVDNKAVVLFETWKGKSSEALLIGPFYQVTHALSADITRQRVGTQFFWSPVESVMSIKRPRLYGQIGLNIQDRNRENQIFLTAGMGFDF